ncbi:hypothetical protein BC937DRAFT_92679 [Endogone sp. FLAS-F59071]|nr:hypothetical protein BC937DRAFT_92679 [Endogone sp. FLAS-F59071]|eukprot:RUS15265.1 hypothetical protein BC937DRAFT_92679 [Endogone sp. FLAS-F59071]
MPRIVKYPISISEASSPVGSPRNQSANHADAQEYQSLTFLHCPFWSPQEPALAAASTITHSHPPLPPISPILRASSESRSAEVPPLLAAQLTRDMAELRRFLWSDQFVNVGDEDMDEFQRELDADARVSVVALLWFGDVLVIFTAVIDY